VEVEANLEQGLKDSSSSAPATECSREAVSDVFSRPGGRSLLRNALGVVLLAIVLADAMRGADTDLWGHIHFGSIVLFKHQLFFHAPSSYACPPGPKDWIMVDWLGEALMALVYHLAGVVGLKLAKFASVAAVIVLLSLSEAETGASLEIQAAVLLASSIALITHMQFRTFLADDVLLAALLWLLSRESYGRGARLWLIVPMLALWANLHGGFFVGLVVMGLYTTVRGVQDLAEGKGTRTAVRLAALTSAATLTTLANPYGLRDWIVIAGVLRNPFTLKHISEFRSLLTVIADFYREGRPLFTFAFAIAIMMGLLVTFVLTPRSDDFALFAIAALMTVASLYAVRNTSLAVIAACVPLCRHVALLTDRRASRPEATVPQPAMSWPAFQALVAAAAIAIAIRTGLLSSRMVAAETKPVGALAFMREHDLHGNVLCEFGWADYMLFHDARAVRIFIESIFEAYYPPTVQSDFAAVTYGEPGAARVLDTYSNDLVLMPTGSPAYQLLMAQTGWQLIFRDPVASLFARAGSRPASLAGVPELHANAPPSFFP
jgi:hypothetical protein